TCVFRRCLYRRVKITSNVVHSSFKTPFKEMIRQIEWNGVEEDGDRFAAKRRKAPKGAVSDEALKSREARQRADRHAGLEGGADGFDFLLASSPQKPYHFMFMSLHTRVCSPRAPKFKVPTPWL